MRTKILNVLVFAFVAMSLVSCDKEDTSKLDVWSYGKAVVKGKVLVNLDESRNTPSWSAAPENIKFYVTVDYGYFGGTYGEKYVVTNQVKYNSETGEFEVEVPAAKSGSAVDIAILPFESSVRDYNNKTIDVIWHKNQTSAQVYPNGTFYVGELTYDGPGQYDVVVKAGDEIY